jgi:hypothetical protein
MNSGKGKNPYPNLREFQELSSAMTVPNLTF